MVGDSESGFRGFSFDAFSLSSSSSQDDNDSDQATTTSSQQQQQQGGSRDGTRIAQELFYASLKEEEEQGKEKRVVGASHLRLPSKHVPYQQEEQEREETTDAFVVGTSDGRLVFLNRFPFHVFPFFHVSLFSFFC